MDEQNQKKTKGFLPYAIVSVAAVLLILAAFLIPSPKREPDVPTLPNPQTDQTEPVTSTEVVPTISVLDTMKMSALIEQYYQAKMEADADTLNRIVVSDRVYHAADLATESNIIQKYDHFRTYVIPSVTGDYFVVYVTYDIYFLGLDIGAPALNHFVLKRDKDQFVIYDKYVSSAFEEELEKTEKTAVVQNLMKQVEADLNEACRQNQDLSELMKFLEENADFQGVTDPDPTGSSDAGTEETAESESESQSESETESESESGSGEETEEGTGQEPGSEPDTAASDEHN